MQIHQKDTLPPGISAKEAAHYSRQMLESLRRLALGLNHTRLATLLEAAESEAGSLAGHPPKRRKSA